MPLKETLAKVENDIANGCLGKARDRLHGLMKNYPNNFEIRKRLGDIYWQLQIGPEMAGRYWYLEEVKDETMEEACKKFEQLWGNREALILRALKYRGNFEEIKDSYAGRVLLALHEKAKVKDRSYRDFRERDTQKKRDHGNVPWLGVGCLILIIIIIFFAIVGVANTFSR